MGTRIAQFDALLSGYRDPSTGLVGAGYTVYFYAAGTTTAKDVWTAYDKTGGAVQSVTLDATGSALVFGDGVYKLVVKNLSAATVDTFDGVKVQAGGYNVTTSTAATLTITTDMDAVLLDCTSTNQVATLPLASTATRPIFFKRICGGVNTITINAAGSDTIDGAASVSLATLNTDVTLVSDGANWYGQAAATTNADTLSGYSIGTAVNTIPLRGADGYISGAVPIATAAQTIAGTDNTVFVTPKAITDLFDDSGRQSLIASGYQKLPGGLLIQWGSFVEVSEWTGAITFPVAFGTALGVMAHIAGDTGSGESCAYIARAALLTTTTFTISKDAFSTTGQGNSKNHYWFAWGIV